jgi:hypothetical protein
MNPVVGPAGAKPISFLVGSGQIRPQSCDAFDERGLRHPRSRPYRHAHMLLVIETTSVEGRREVEVGIVSFCEQSKSPVGLTVRANLRL